MSTYLDAILSGSGTGVASALKTSGEAGNVDVGQSDSPNAGDVLTATDSQHARWSPPAGGGGGGGSGALASHVIVDDFLIAELSTAYFCAQPRTVVTLPDASAPDVAGRGLRITFSQSMCVLASSEPANFFLLENTIINEPLTGLTAGTYECTAFYDGAAYPVGIWVVRRGTSTWGRRSFDVTSCMPEPLPEGYTLIPQDSRWKLQSFDTAAALPYDGPGTYAVGDTVLVPFDTNESSRQGIYRVNINSGTTWELELIQAPNLGYAVGGDCEQTEVTILTGDIWGGRRWTNDGAHTALRFTPVHDVLEAYPATGDTLDGTSTTGGFIYPKNVVVPGRVNLLDIVEGDPTFTLAIPTAPSGQQFYSNGDRFALKCVTETATGPHSVTILVNMRMEGDVPIVPGVPNTVVQMTSGTYLEWMVMDGTWRI